VCSSGYVVVIVVAVRMIVRIVVIMIDDVITFATLQPLLAIDDEARACSKRQKGEARGELFDNNPKVYQFMTCQLKRY
jgi:hypothetical protein